MVMQFENLFIGIIVFSVFIVSGVFMIGNINTNYNINISTSEFNDTYNQIDSMYNISMDSKDKVLDADLEGSDETIDSMTKGSYSGLRITAKSSFSLINNIINDVSKALGIPSFFVKFAITALLLSIVLAIIFFIRGIRT